VDKHLEHIPQNSASRTDLRPRTSRLGQDTRSVGGKPVNILYKSAVKRYASPQGEGCASIGGSSHRIVSTRVKRKTFQSLPACAVSLGILFSVCASICSAQSSPGAANPAATPTETPPAPADVAALKQQLVELQAQLSVLQAKASVAQASADAAQAGAKENASNQAAIAQAQASIATANRTALTQNYPTNLVTPLEGKMTVDAGYKFPPQVLAYTSSDKMIGDIADAMQPYLTSATKVVVFAASDISIDQKANAEIIRRSVNDKTESFQTLGKKYKSFTDSESKLESVSEQAAIFIDKVKNPTKPGVAPLFMGAGEALTGVNSTLQSFIQLISLFRTDTTIAGVQADIDLDALEAQFCFHLLYDKSHIRRNGPLIVEMPSGLPLTPSGILDAIQAMQKEQSQNAANISDAKLAVTRLATAQQAIDDEIKKRTEKEPTITTKAQQLEKDAFKSANDELAALTKGMTDLDTAATTLITTLETPDSKTGLYPLAGVLKTEAVSRELGKAGNYGIALKTVLAGGATKITRNLFTGSRLTELGGSIFVSTLSNSAGNILYSNASKGFIGFTKVSGTAANRQQDIPPEHHFLWWHWPAASSPPFTAASSGVPGR
jgi:hypothetical protein